MVCAKKLKAVTWRYQFTSASLYMFRLVSVSYCNFSGRFGLNHESRYRDEEKSRTVLCIEPGGKAREKALPTPIFRCTQSSR